MTIKVVCCRCAICGKEKEMAQVLVNFRMDENLKHEMEKTCRCMGLSMSAAFTIFAKKVTMEQRIPFEIAVGNAQDKNETNTEA